MKFYIEEIICFVIAFGFWIYSLVLLINGSNTNMDTGLTEAVIAGAVALVVGIGGIIVIVWRTSKSNEKNLIKTESELKLNACTNTISLSKEHGDLSKEHTKIEGKLDLSTSEIKDGIATIATISGDVKSSVGKVGDSVLSVKDAINEEKIKREALHSMFTSREHDINETMKEFSEFMSDWESKIGENAKLKQDKLILEGKLSGIREKLSVLEPLSELPEKLKTASAEITMLSEKLSGSEAANSALQTRLGETEQALKASSAEITMLSERLSDFEAANSTLQARLGELEQSQEDENEI